MHYEVDKAVLSQIQEENFNHPVLRCLNPEGDIQPGEAAILEWIFSPLEAKLYQVKPTNSTGCEVDKTLQISHALSFF